MMDDTFLKLDKLVNGRKARQIENDPKERSKVNRFYKIFRRGPNVLLSPIGLALRPAFSDTSKRLTERPVFSKILESKVGNGPVDWSKAGTWINE